jgi:hypothetical protein
MLFYLKYLENFSWLNLLFAKNMELVLFAKKRNLSEEMLKIVWLIDGLFKENSVKYKNGTRIFVG